MTRTAKEWFGKAEADFATAEREFAVHESANYDAVCYHCQQCVEKTMKALLIHWSMTPPYTHDLLRLSGLLHDADRGWDCDEADLRLLGHAAVAFRYPGEDATREHASIAIETCVRLRQSLDDLRPKTE